MVGGWKFVNAMLNLVEIPLQRRRGNNSPSWQCAGKECNQMKAVRMHTRAGPEASVYEDVPAPKISEGEVVIKVHAAGITPTEFTWNSTFTTSDGVNRLPIVPSFEVSGTVHEAAPDVTDLSVGDAMYGLLNFWRDGAAAEYVAARGADMAPKPKSLDHLQAAAVPLSGLTAWQALFDHAKLSAHDRILIHGAAGGVGTWAVQFAHWRGAHVIGTASQRNHQFLRGLGATDVLDYKSSHFEDEVRDVDVVLDTVGGDTLERSWRVVRKGGFLVTVVGDAPEEKAKRFGVSAASILVQPNRAQLIEIANLIDSGTVRPLVQAVYPLAQAKEAYERGLQGHNRGKLVLQVYPDRRATTASVGP
jgi:NADPH:quinone reductase-like Zn-dependent oxidoreductase